VLFQAGASTRGRQFAAEHAECVFINGPSQHVVRNLVSDIRKRTAAVGRNPAEINILTMMTVITGRTTKEAQDKLADYRNHVSEEAALALMSGWTGVDFSKLDPDKPIPPAEKGAMSSALEAFTTNAEPGRVWTPREVARHAAIGGRGPVIVGSAVEVADALLDWIANTDLDGFNLAYAVVPETFADIADLVVPILQERGAFKHDYAPGTLREKLYGPGRARLGVDHPAARFRHS